MTSLDSNHYLDICEASKSAAYHGISTKVDYFLRYLVDEKLPEDPSQVYSKDWQGWKTFFKCGCYYPYEEASKTSQEHGYKTSAQYKSNCEKDPRLPSKPERSYKTEWKGWEFFLGTKTNCFYEDICQAKQAVRYLGINSMVEYRKYYMIDARLPATPNYVYRAEWKGTRDFLGKEQKKYHTKLKEASRSAISLGITSKNEYERNYKKDSRLPSAPERLYPQEWKSWAQFLGKVEKNFYPTLVEASNAACALGIRTTKEYRKKYLKDPRLPSTPWTYYSNKWQSSNSFFGRSDLYKSLKEASNAAKKMGFTSMVEYRAGRLKDKSLPANPSKVYEDEWKGAAHFLGLQKVELYSNLNKASNIAIELGFKTKEEYLSGRHKDQKLPYCPNEVYEEDWTNWPSFLGTEDRFYSTLSEASRAAVALGFKTMKEYKNGLHLDPKLPACPDHVYAEDWKGSHNFFCKPANRFYPTLQEASNSAINLKIISPESYKKEYKIDNKLPLYPYKVYPGEWTNFSDFLGLKMEQRYKLIKNASLAAQKLKITSAASYKADRHKNKMLPPNPVKFYKDTWEGWDLFLNVRNFYPTLIEASNATRTLGATTMAAYRKLRSSDPRLPAKPTKFYADEWQGSKKFLNTLSNPFYSNLKQATEAARKLGCETANEYRSNRHLDSKLPATPQSVYKDEWTGWASFLVKRKKLYSCYLEASAAAQKLFIRTMDEYQLRYRADPLLPSNPNQYYSADWKGAGHFLGTETRRFYPTVSEASKAAMNLGVTTVAQYKAACYKDPSLPYCPERTYAKDWKGMPNFLGKLRSNIYQTFIEAKEAVRSLSCVNATEYRERRLEVPRLPSAPAQYYKADWQGWVDFLLPSSYRCLNDVKLAVKILGLKDSKVYRENYRKHPPLPANPDRKFKEEWIDWYDLCDIPRPYSYSESARLVAKEKLSSKSEYIDFIIETGDQKLPRTPDVVYKEDWINWYVYLGRKEPYRIKNIRKPYEQWAACIVEFLRGARAGESKESYICRFVRDYIQEYEMGVSPQQFLTLEKKDIRPFKDWLAKNETNSIAHKTLASVNEFLDFIVKRHLTDEDDETGELILVANTHNPFSNLTVENKGASNPSPGESVKHALAYQYVNSAREWIIPAHARKFNELSHLHEFNADWVDIDPVLIDETDPNCVVRRSGKKCQIWFPAFWLHTYALMSVPARGRQIAYCDSGEADDEIPIIVSSDTLSLAWKPNHSSLAGQTKHQGFVKKYENDEFGMNFTSNKTGIAGKGYSVAWIPEELAYWMVQLRDWQLKYNPIYRTMPWVECKRTSLNENQRIKKGSNCFLFRDFGSEEPGHYQGRLASRLAVSLYKIQPNDLTLAAVIGDGTYLNHYVSRYTPHSMRVSLITAYVEEFGLPLQIIMKIAGHSSIVMTIYYCKIGSEDLRRRFSEGEKRSMQNKTYAAQRMIEQGRIDEIKNELISTSEGALNLITNETPVGTYLFRDYGICPYGGQRCYDGGEEIKKSQLRSATPVGYLGSQNCIACRHLITGPAFIGGLLSLGNEISLASHLQYEHYNKLEQDLNLLNEQINRSDDAAYDAELKGYSLNVDERNNLELRKRKTLSEMESAAKKLDALLCDINKASKLLKQCQALVNQDAYHSSGSLESTPTKLIVHREHELEINYDEVSKFYQLCEVCENAEIYQSASSEIALAPRSQLIDKMALRNSVPIHMFTLDKEQQLVIGNQITRLMLNRLKTWERVDALIDGKIDLDDLEPEERITRVELIGLVKNDHEFITKS